MIHDNSRLSYANLDVSRREREVLDALRVLGIATDRQIAQAMGSEDCNISRPRITALIAKGMVQEIGYQRDEVTGRKVRLIEVR